MITARNSPEELEHRYRTGDSLRKLCAYSGMNRSEVTKILRGRGVEFRKNTDHIRPAIGEYMVSDLVSAYLNGASSEELGRKFGVSSKTIRVTLRKNRHSKFTEAQEAEICRRYKEGEASPALSVAYKTNSPSIRKVLAKHGLLSDRRYLTGSDHHNWSGRGKVPATYVSYVKRSADLRKLHFELDTDYLSGLFEGQKEMCALSGVSICFGKAGKETTASLDRKDSRSGYIRGNVQWVHKTINLMKRSMSDEEFVRWCKGVAKTIP